MRRSSSESLIQRPRKDAIVGLAAPLPYAAKTDVRGEAAMAASELMYADGAMLQLLVIDRQAHNSAGSLAQDYRTL